MRGTRTTGFGRHYPASQLEVFLFGIVSAGDCRFRLGGHANVDPVLPSSKYRPGQQQARVHEVFNTSKADPEGPAVIVPA